MYPTILLMHLIAYVFLLGFSLAWCVLAWQLAILWRRRRWWANARYSVALLAFLAFICAMGVTDANSTVRLIHGGGRASNKRIEKGKYYFENFGRLTEVSEPVWRLKRSLEVVEEWTTPVGIVAVILFFILMRNSHDWWSQTSGDQEPSDEVGQESL
jgi:hypothetical protein